MLIIHNPVPLLLEAANTDSVLQLMEWMDFVEKRQDAVYTVYGIERRSAFPVLITYPSSPDYEGMHGGLCLSDDKWSVHT